MMAGISTWLLTAEARGSLPSGSFDASPQIDWPVTPAHAAAIREDALSRAAVREPGLLRGSSGPAGTSTGGTADLLTCRYLADKREVELLSAFADIIPVTMIARMIGIPEEMGPQLLA